MSKENWVTYELGVYKDDPDNASCSNTVITGAISGLLLFNQPRHHQTHLSRRTASVDALFFIGLLLEHTIKAYWTIFAGFNFLGNCSKRQLLLTSPRMALEIVLQFIFELTIMVHKLIKVKGTNCDNIEPGIGIFQFETVYGHTKGLMPNQGYVRWPTYSFKEEAFCSRQWV